MELFWWSLGGVNFPCGMRVGISSAGGSELQKAGRVDLGCLGRVKEV